MIEHPSPGHHGSECYARRMHVKVGSVAFLRAAGSGYGIGLDDDGHRVEFLGEWRALAELEPELDLQRLRRDFHLDEDLTADVQSYNTFLERLEEVRYSPLAESQLGENAAFTIGVAASQDSMPAVPESGSAGDNVVPAEGAESALEAEESTAPTE